MRYSHSNPAEPGTPVENPRTTEDLLRQEIEDLKKQLAAKSAAHVDLHTAKPPHPSRGALWLLMVVIVVVIAGAFLAGFIPRARRESVIASETQAQQEALPVVSVVTAANSSSVSELVLPGNVQAVTEAPVLARADGYIKRRLVDIGDRVAAGQLLAELEAPELDQQVRQAQASLAQAKSSQEQASASLDQGRGLSSLAAITAKRWSNLAVKGVVSRQENDTYQSQ
jgi:multidrug efflux pump subunit AcrA (membrane-fusion protein)